jgi:hypothetical protein
MSDDEGGSDPAEAIARLYGDWHRRWADLANDSTVQENMRRLNGMISESMARMVPFAPMMPFMGMAPGASGAQPGPQPNPQTIPESPPTAPDPGLVAILTAFSRRLDQIEARLHALENAPPLAAAPEPAAKPATKPTAPKPSRSRNTASARTSPASAAAAAEAPTSKSAAPKPAARKPAARTRRTEAPDT